MIASTGSKKNRGHPHRVSFRAYVCFHGSCTMRKDGHTSAGGGRGVEDTSRQNMHIKGGKRAKHSPLSSLLSPRGLREGKKVHKMGQIFNPSFPHHQRQSRLYHRSHEYQKLCCVTSTRGLSHMLTILFFRLLCPDPHTDRSALLTKKTRRNPPPQLSAMAAEHSSLLSEWMDNR